MNRIPNIQSRQKTSKPNRGKILRKVFIGVVVVISMLVILLVEAATLMPLVAKILFGTAAALCLFILWRFREKSYN